MFKKKYEYTALFIPVGKPIVEELNNMGEQGWELVGTPDITKRDGETSAVAFFKRKK